MNRSFAAVLAAAAVLPFAAMANPPVNQHGRLVEALSAAFQAHRHNGGSSDVLSGLAQCGGSWTALTWPTGLEFRCVIDGESARRPVAAIGWHFLAPSLQANGFRVYADYRLTDDEAPRHAPFVAQAMLDNAARAVFR